MDWITGWIVFSIGVGIIAALRARSFIGWAFLSLIISPLFAVIILALAGRGDEEERPTRDTHVKCPDCAELVLKEAKVCKHCHCRLVPQA
jgi:hypothetical protein